MKVIIEDTTDRNWALIEGTNELFNLADEVVINGHIVKRHEQSREPKDGMAMAPMPEHEGRFTVVIVRCDGTAPVEREGVKHAWWQGSRLVLAFGEHGTDRRYEHWPEKVIDHVRVIEHEAHV